MRRYFHAILVAALCVALSSQAVFSQCQYEVTGIIQGPSCPFSGPPHTFATGMNEQGWVVGYYKDCDFSWINHAFIWKPGEGMTTLPKPRDVASSFASDINDDGYIVGGHTFIEQGTKAFVFNPQTQEYTYLEPLHEGVSATNVTTANAINNNLVIVGSRLINRPGESNVTNAVIWYPYGENGNGREVVIDLGDFGVGPNSTANDLNLDGITVGWSGTSIPSTIGFLHESRDFVIIGQGFGATTSNATSINTHGLIGGNGKFFGSSHTIGFVLSTKLILIESLPGYTQCGVRDLNDLGQAAIVSTPGNAPGLWQHGVHHALAPLILPSNPAVTILQPIAIDNAGRIVTRGTVEARTVGVLLSPADRPLADLNADCVTDFHDLLILLGEWGKPDSPADLNGNGTVGVPDLLFLLSNWGVK